jgi:hypothetical protein
MTTDLSARLRALADFMEGGYYSGGPPPTPLTSKDFRAAADLIDTLRLENERLGGILGDYQSLVWYKQARHLATLLGCERLSDVPGRVEAMREWIWLARIRGRLIARCNGNGCEECHTQAKWIESYTLDEVAADIVAEKARGG